MSLHDDLIAAGLPVKGTAIEGATVLWTRPLTPAETTTAESIINPAAYSFTVDKAQLKAAYTDMMTRLSQIQSVTNPTNAQVIQAVKDIALYEERIMKVIKALVT